MMNEKQKKALECLNGIAQYAKEQKLSARMLDNIEECKKQIMSKNINWNEINLEVEDIIKSIERKTTPVSVYVDKNKNEISIQAIKTQITKVAESCHAENVASMEMMSERKITVLKRAYSEIQEISYIKAHSRELKNDDLYLEFFQKAKREYESNVFQIFRGLFEDISSNYDHMLAHIKSMFQSIGGYTTGVGNETFYHKYAEKKEALDKKMLSEAETSETGGSDIISFGIRTKDAIKNIRKKLNRRTRLLMWAPVLLILATLLISFSVKTITYINQNKPAIESTKKTLETKDDTKTGNTSEEKESLEELRNELKETVKNLEDISASEMKPEMGMDKLTGLKFVLIVSVLIIIFYAAYIIILKLWCNGQIRKRCGEYLKTETIQFEQSNVLMPKLEDSMKYFIEEYERQYLVILNSIFSGTNYDFNNTEKEVADQFTVLKESWNALKYM